MGRAREANKKINDQNYWGVWRLKWSHNSQTN